MHSARNRPEFAVRLRQGMILYDNFVQSEGRRPKRRLDGFFLYTSVSGLCLLHSRNPLWFQVMSAVALVLSFTCCVYQSWTFVERFLQPGHPAQLTTSNYRRENFPHVIVCPLRKFRMLEANYAVHSALSSSLLSFLIAGDFAFILTLLWVEPDVEPRISNRTLGRFSNETLAEVSAFFNRTADRQSMADLSRLSEKIRSVMPECGMLVNISNALRLLDSRFQWETHDEYMEQKMQNDSCYKQRSNDSHSFYLCRRFKARSLLQRTIQNLRQLQHKLKSKPPLDGFILECRWFDGSECKYEAVDSPYGIQCWEVSSRLSTSITSTTSFSRLKSQSTLKCSTIRRTGGRRTKFEWIHDKERRIPEVLSGRTGGKREFAAESLGLLPLGRRFDFGPGNQLIYGYGPIEDACLWRRFNVDYSMTPLLEDSPLFSKWKAEREGTWRMIDRLVQDSIGVVYAPYLTEEMRKLFDEYFQGTFLLGKIVQSTHLLQRNKPIPISKACAESVLIQEVRQKADALLVWIHSIEENTTARKTTVGFADSVRDDSHPIPTKFVRYYADPKNIEQLGEHFDKLYELLTDLRNHLLPASECFELEPSVRKFLTETSMVRRTVYNDKQSVLESRLVDLLKRRDARLIYEDYVKHNYVNIRVRFRHLYGQVISKADEYTAFRLIADIGCTMGLYFGLSVLTFYEFPLFVFVKDAAEGTTGPPPHRTQIYGKKKTEGGEGRRNSVHELHIPPPLF